MCWNEGVGEATRVDLLTSSWLCWFVMLGYPQCASAALSAQDLNFTDPSVRWHPHHTATC